MGCHHGCTSADGIRRCRSARLEGSGARVRMPCFKNAMTALGAPIAGSWQRMALLNFRMKAASDDIRTKEERLFVLQQKLQVMGMGIELSQNFMQNSQSMLGKGQLVRTFGEQVLGEGTSFEEQVTVGSKICCLSQVRTVVSIAGATTLVVDKAFDPGITEAT